jgi:hypothetical protein
MGNAKALASLAPLLCGAALQAQSLWQDGFESRLPGERPEGWSLAWGKMPPSDGIFISNMECLDGTRSMLFERFEAEGGESIFGFCRKTSKLPAKGTAELRAPFFACGPGDQMNFVLEIRDASGRGRLTSAVFRNGGVSTERAGKPSLPLRFNQWQRLVLRLPIGQEGAKGSLALETRQPDGSWKQEREPLELGLEKGVPGGKELCPMLCSWPGKGSFTIYFDALSLAILEK